MLDPALHRWLRFNIATPTVNLLGSEDGVTWTTLHTEEIDFEYTNSSIGISVSNFAPLPQAETVSVRSFEVCLK